MSRVSPITAGGATLESSPAPGDGSSDLQEGATAEQAAAADAAAATARRRARFEGWYGSSDAADSDTPEHRFERPRDADAVDTPPPDAAAAR